MADAGREQVNARFTETISDILTSDITAQDVVQYKIKSIGILTNVKVN
jgi:hypothetical protein